MQRRPLQLPPLGDSALDLSQESPQSWAQYLRLGAAAANTVLVCAEHLCHAQLATVGFAEVLTYEQLTQEQWATRSWLGSVEVVLVVFFDLRLACRCCATIGANPSVPIIVALRLMQMGDFTPAVMAAHDALLSAQADEVLDLGPEQYLTSRRLRAVILRQKKHAQVVESVIQSERADAVAGARTQIASHFLWGMPGKALDNVPAVDTSLEEKWTAGSAVIASGRVGEYTFTDFLGTGSFGSVVKAEHPAHGAVAIKIFWKGGIRNTTALLRLDTEFGLVKFLPPHKNLARGLEVLHGQSHLYFVMEYAGCCDLHKFAEAVCEHDAIAALPPHVVEPFCFQEAAAIAHLHHNKVCHRDLKPTNFVVSSDERTLKLIDLGLAAFVHGPEQRLTEACGSLPFCAPEVLRQRQGSPGYDGFAADVWSLAVNFFELLHGPNSIEAALHWESRPTDWAELASFLEGLAPLASAAPDAGCHRPQRAIAGMLMLRPEDRLTACHVLGPQGLGPEELPRPKTKPAQRGPRAFRALQQLRATTALASWGVPQTS